MSRIRDLVVEFIGLLRIEVLNLECHQVPLLALQFCHQELVSIRQVVIQRLI